MITVKGQLSKKEQLIVSSLLEELTDTYSDFYLTKNNLRLYIKENSELMFESLKNGDKVTFSEENGIIFIHGWSDKANRHYIKILSKDQQSADKLIKVMLWKLGNIELFAKVKKNNPIKSVLEKNGFKFRGDRGKEVLLYRIGIIKSKVTLKET